LSFIDEGKTFKINTYFTAVIFLAVNNCYLLGNNNFIGEYFLGSLIGLLLLSFLCNRLIELAALIVANLIAFFTALHFITTPVDDLPIMLIAVAIFSGLTCVIFLLRRAFIVNYLNVRGEVLSQKKVIEKTNDVLGQHVNKLIV